MELRILGPIEAVEHGESLALGGSRSRALLAALLVNPGVAVTRDALIDGLWTSPPATASHAVEVFASRLRRTLGRERIRCQGHAYRAELESAELDLVRFRTLARIGRDAAFAGDRETAARALSGALAVWRGEAVACLNGEPLARDVRGFLEEERLATVELELDVRLSLGHHDELVPELRRLVTVHPTRERLWQRLMLALYRSGRQTDALDAYRCVRGKLRDDVGVEPGPELRAIHRRILDQDPSLDVCATAPLVHERRLSDR